MPDQIILAEEAHKRREMFVDIHGKSRVIEMRLLYEMWNNEDWESLGFDSFKDYFESPVQNGGLELSRSWAVELIKTYEKYSVELGMSDELLSKLSSRKLYFLKDEATKENLDEIVSKVETLPLKALEMERKGIDESTCPCPPERSETFNHCLDCGQWKKI